MDDRARRYALVVGLGTVAGLALSVGFGISASFPVFLARSLATVGLTIALLLAVVTGIENRR